MAERRADTLSEVYDARTLLTVFGPIVAVAAAVACGSSYGGEDGVPLPSRDGATDAPSEGALDGTTPDASTPDASAAPECDVTKAFTKPVPISELNTGDIDIASSLSPDELTIYVGTNHGVVAGFQQFYATRGTKTAPWGLLQPSFPAGAWDNWGVGVTADGLTAVVSSDRNGNNSELYVATRVSTLASFGGLGLIPEPTNSTGNEESPHWSADGKTLYFDSTRGGNRDLYRVALVGASFGIPEVIPELQSLALDAAPVISADELTIYFVSTRAPSPDGDIYVATRTSKSAPFGTPKQLENVNSPKLDGPAHVSADGCTLYMSSDRDGPSDVYVARRPK